MSRKVLVVEDENAIRELVVMYLQQEGFRTLTATNGIEALRQIQAGQPDLVVLDIMLPEMSGLEVCQRIRFAPSTSALPVVMLTAKNEETDILMGLELGADDYVTKPFSPKELIARIKAVFRMMDRKYQEHPTVHRYGGLSLDVSQFRVTLHGKEISLTTKEFGLLEHLVRHPGRVLTRDVLLNRIWGYDYHGTTRTIDVHVARLKHKIPALNESIISVKCLGYKLKERDPNTVI